MTYLDKLNQLIELGIPIFPVCHPAHTYATRMHVDRCKCAGKTPLIKGWAYHNQTYPKHIKQWIAEFGNFNIGVALGTASGLIGIDVDGKQGEVLLKEMSGGILPLSWEFSTSNECRRILYQIPPGTRTKKVVAVGDGAHQECALLCDGQQTVLPPSLHLTGIEYAWKLGYSPWDIDCAMAPQWLLDMITDETDAPKVADEFVIELDMDNLEEQFISTPFSEDLQKVNYSTLKKSKGKEGNKKSRKSIVTDEILTSPIPEGSRDNIMTSIIGHYCANPDLRRLGKEMVLQVCQQHNVKYCDPPLDIESIRSKVEHFMSAEAQKTNEYKANASKATLPDFLPRTLVPKLHVLLKDKNIALHYDQIQRIFYYCDIRKGPWTPMENEELLKGWCRTLLITVEPTWDKLHFINEFIAVLKESFTISFKYLGDFDIGKNATKLQQYIIMKNGMLDWEKGELVPWDYRVLTTLYFDIEFNEDAECPKFKQYLQEWLPEEASRKVIQEYIGYCLIPMTNYRKALFLYGKGANGKSILIEYLQNYLFKDTCVSLPYDKLLTRFGPVKLKDKLINIYDDTDIVFTNQTGLLKNLIAGGTFNAEYKNKNSFEITNTARFLYSAQETPKTSDHSDAWYLRWIFVKFPNTFKVSHSKKTEMHTAMAYELQGIFNWAVEGLKRLIAQDGFTESAFVEECHNLYRISNDSVAEFINALCMSESRSSSSGVSLKILYEIYKYWSKDNNYPPLGKKRFQQRLLDLHYDVAKLYHNRKTYIGVPNLHLDEESEDWQSNAIEYNIMKQMTIK